jgi:hypothetical protein
MLPNFGFHICELCPRRESNPGLKLGRLVWYHYTTGTSVNLMVYSQYFSLKRRFRFTLVYLIFTHIYQNKTDVMFAHCCAGQQTEHGAFLRHTSITVLYCTLRVNLVDANSWMRDIADQRSNLNSLQMLWSCARDRNWDVAQFVFVVGQGCSCEHLWLCLAIA